MRTIVYWCVLSGLLLTSCQKQDLSIKSKKETKKSKNVKKTIAGLKTFVLQEANKHAPQPAIGDTVVVHYQAWIHNRDGSRGKMIDNSYSRQRPLSFTIGLGEVVPGFEAGVSSMKIGEKRRLIISPELAYGKRGIGLFIPPDSTLEFEVSLLGFS